MLTSPLLARHRAIAHGFFTRAGGVSTGLYSSLNCGHGSRDDPEKVRENRACAMRLLGADPADLRTLHQIHSAKVVTVDPASDPSARHQADAMVSAHPGLVIGILTADCAPVLFADADAGVVGAAHAGWRGAIGGVLEATIAAMVQQGARREAIEACIGPTIAQASYEVGPEFPRPFLAETADYGRFFTDADRAGHFMFDLPGFIVHRLTAAGIASADDLGLDTYEKSDDFFSYRRNTHNGESDYGRLLAAIRLRP